MRTQEGNLFFSPYSISTALGMTRAGVRGESAKQMDRVLHFGLNQKKVHSGFKNLIDNLHARQRNGKNILHIANALWILKDLAIRKEFIDIINTQYNAEAEKLNGQDLEKVKQTINAWVEKKTKGKIKELFHEGGITQDAVLVLTNAVYFKGRWESPFKEEHTSNEPFTLSSGEKVQVPMMFQKNEFRFLEEKTFKALEIAYIGEELSMLILLPNRHDGLPELENSITVPNLKKWLKKMSITEVELHLPKFTIEFSFQLNTILSSMGMTDIFLQGKADLSGMFDVSQTKSPMYVGDTIHKAYINVNEKGTEAAAATGIPAECKPLSFIADHPFVFIIRDSVSGIILFMGRMMNPQVQYGRGGH